MAAILSAVPSTAAPDLEAPRGGVWHVRLLGSIEARNGEVVLTHFVSRPIAALLARLALHPQRQHPREELVELLWPGVELDVGRNRLRNAISSLRRLLEPPGTPAGSVLVADRQSLQLAPESSRCDVIEFERCVRERRFDDARHWHLGELLPGFYDNWVQEERARLAVLWERVASALAAPAAAGIAGVSPDEADQSARAQPAPIPLRLAPMLPTRSARLLPSYLTTYFGREQERLRLADQVSACRLVTLIGMGGAGKTRLAVEVAGAIAGFDVVAFAALAECTSAAQCAAQLRVALQLAPGRDSLDSVVAFLVGARPLLVLDNCEQLVAGDAPYLIERLLERLPELHLLVTSRRGALGLPGEREFGLMPLPQPDPAASLQEIAQSPSVALFVDRARAVRHDFQVTERNHEAIAALCCALEGMPLAIELAASRSRAFTPADMHAALADRFSLLARPVAPSGSGTPRHDSLRAAIDWSWQLLPAHQQRFLLALSVFRGGWTAASAEAVSGMPQARALLEQLAADSLLRVDVGDDGSQRFGMLEMIRDFLCERLDADEAAGLQGRHRARGLAIAEAQGAPGGHGVDAAELANVNEALRTALDDGEVGFALALGLALRDHWERTGIEPASLALIVRALDPQRRARQCLGRGLHDGGVDVAREWRRARCAAPGRCCARAGRAGLAGTRARAVRHACASLRKRTARPTASRRSSTTRWRSPG